MLQFWVAKKKYSRSFLTRFPGFIIRGGAVLGGEKKNVIVFSCEHLDAFGPTLSATVGEFAGPNLRLRRG